MLHILEDANEVKNEVLYIEGELYNINGYCDDDVGNHVDHSSWP